MQPDDCSDSQVGAGEPYAERLMSCLNQVNCPSVGTSTPDPPVHTNKYIFCSFSDFTPVRAADNLCKNKNTFSSNAREAATTFQLLLEQ